MSSTARALAPLSLLVRLLGPAALALAAAWTFDWMCRRKGLMPPGFRHPWRRAAASALVFLILWFGIFAPLGTIGLPEPQLDLSSISTPRLFLLHGMLVAVVLGWFALGFAGTGAAAGKPLAPAPGEPALSIYASAPQEMPPIHPLHPPAPTPFGRQLAAQLGFVAPSVSREVAIGLALGLCAWGAVLLALFVAALGIYAVGGEKALPKPSAIVPWIASLPVLVRVMVSLSAGFVEETFFRGFLQPRVGIALSTGCFVLAHLSYGQPFMLLGITLLSLIYAFLVRWRQTIWPAIAAHALFDGVQLLVIIPLAMKWARQAPGVLGWIW
jgi:membrane protease YdiL (CAAX protease family)